MDPETHIHCRGRQGTLGLAPSPSLALPLRNQDTGGRNRRLGHSAQPAVSGRTVGGTRVSEPGEGFLEEVVPG